MKQLKEKIIRFAVRNRKSPEGKSPKSREEPKFIGSRTLRCLLVNFAVIIGTGSKFW